MKFVLGLLVVVLVVIVVALFIVWSQNFGKNTRVLKTSREYSQAEREAILAALPDVSASSSLYAIDPQTGAYELTDLGKKVLKELPEVPPGKYSAEDRQRILESLGN